MTIPKAWLPKRAPSYSASARSECPQSTPIADLLAAYEQDPRCGTVRRLRTQAEELLRQKREEALRGGAPPDIAGVRTARELAQERLNAAIAAFRLNPSGAVEMASLIQSSLDLEHLLQEHYAHADQLWRYPQCAKVLKKVRAAYVVRPRWAVAFDGLSLLALLGAVLVATFALTGHVPQSALNAVVLMFALLELLGEFGRQALEKRDE